ncbi:hypothetical protein JNUCC0626_50510 (plasmid) [Lentzea sp. JNUCC 0626]|uniref:hypothetical protein n=1 Tax=Lentzea sp. JNUCC 0626 TaxID=3367513 RepID=UPI003749493F
MFRAVRRQLLHCLQPYQSGSRWYEATAVLVIPLEYSAAEPRWSPGPGFVEISTASKWGYRDPDGRLHAVVRSTDRHTDHQVLIRGALSAADLLGFGGITDKPHRLRWMALPGTLSEERLTDTHPAMLYDRWRDALFASAQHRLALTGLPDECCDRVDLTRRPDGRYQVVLRLTAESEYFAADVDDISRALTQIAASYGPGTRVNLYRRGDAENVIDPLYDQAWRQLRVESDQVPGTFVDRLTDLVQRASAAAGD